MIDTIVIILGLYLVVGDKRKYHDTPNSIIKDEALPVKKSTKSNEKDELPNDAIITSGNFVAIDHDEQV